MKAGVYEYTSKEKPIADEATGSTQERNEDVNGSGVNGHRHGF
jgi:hypothetical protein